MGLCRPLAPRNDGADRSDSDVLECRDGRDHTSILTKLPLTPASPSIVAALLMFSAVRVGTALPLFELFEVLDVLLEPVALDADVAELEELDELAVLAAPATGWKV